MTYGGKFKGTKMEWDIEFRTKLHSFTKPTGLFTAYATVVPNGKAIKRDAPDKILQRSDLRRGATSFDFAHAIYKNSSSSHALIIITPQQFEMLLPLACVW